MINLFLISSAGFGLGLVICQQAEEGVSTDEAFKKGDEIYKQAAKLAEQETNE